MGQLIEQEYDIKRAYEQNSDAVQAWLQGEHPGIEQPAKRKGVEVHCVTSVSKKSGGRCF